MGKKIFRSRIVQTVLSVILAAYMQLVKRTTKWRVEGLEIIEPVWAEGNGVIGALWHSRVLMTIAGWPMDEPPGKQPPSFLISLSPDGAFVAQATKRLGLGVIRGSAGNPQKQAKNKGGASALRQMIAHIEDGGLVGLTPDGPRGPRMRASMGAVQLAAKTGAPILCFAWSSTKVKFFDSWDRFCLPLPFGRGVIVWEGPVLVPANADAGLLEQKRLELEQKINSATRRADLACGQTPIEPAGEQTR